MKTLYLHCTSGISGDMTVAALLDLGADEEALRHALGSLHVDGYRIEISRVEKCGIMACDFDVILDHDPHEHSHDHAPDGVHTHDHNHEHPHDHAHSQDGEHSHGHDHNHHEHGHTPSHEHSHSHDHEHPHSHSHEHRNLPSILHIIEHADLTPRAKKLAGDIFRVVAAAEARVHGKPLDEVHFHEVGAVDSIVDIVATAVCVDNLGVERVLCSPLSEGTGTVWCQHGRMPVPAPATLEIAREHAIPLHITDNVGEMVTPTGAAIVAALAEGFSPPSGFTVQAVGYGAGKREFKNANVLRAMLIEASGEADEEVLELSCNLDDMTGEALSYACERLLEAGALDVWCTPIQMKKGRPAQMLSVLAHPTDGEALTTLLLTHTTTLGVRRTLHARTVMERRVYPLLTRYGEVLVKESQLGEICKTKIEYDSAKKLADATNIPLHEILNAAYHELNR